MPKGASRVTPIPRSTRRDENKPSNSRPDWRHWGPTWSSPATSAGPGQPPNGWWPPPGLTSRSTPTLREVYLGGWEGLNRQEAEAAFPEEFLAWSSGTRVRRGGGETEDEAGRRAASAIGEAMRSQPGLVVVVSHGLVLQSAIRFLALDGWIQDGGKALHLPNGEFVAFSVDGGPWCPAEGPPGTV